MRGQCEYESIPCPALRLLERSITIRKHILISYRCPPQHYVSLNAPLLRQNEQRFKTQTDYLNMAASPEYNQVATQDVGDEQVLVIFDRL